MTSIDVAPTRPEQSPSPVPSGALACERCGNGFHCGAQDPAPCPCTTLRLNDSQRRALSARYQHCLCIACLAAIAAGEPLAR